MYLCVSSIDFGSRSANFGNIRHCDLFLSFIFLQQFVIVMLVIIFNGRDTRGGEGVSGNLSEQVSLIFKVHVIND